MAGKVMFGKIASICFASNATRPLLRPVVLSQHACCSRLLTREVLPTPALPSFYFCRKFSDDKVNLRLPKRPSNAYLLFYKETYHKVVVEEPESSPTERTKRLAALWRKLNAEQKEIYQKLYMDNKVLYESQLDEFMNGLTVEQKRRFENEQFKKRQLGKRKALKMKLKLHDKPKYPPTAYILYYQEEYSRQRLLEQKKTMLEISKMIGLSWGDLSLKQKKEYQDRAAELSTKYKTDIAVWEQRMRDEGHLTVLNAYIKGVAKTRKSKERKSTAAKKGKQALKKEE